MVIKKAEVLWVMRKKKFDLRESNLAKELFEPNYSETMTRAIIFGEL